MPEHVGSARPGGRTSKTRRAVHDAVRELRRDPEAELSIPSVAARSGVHATTIYRRWQTIESLVFDVAVEDVNSYAPIPATGDLEADLRHHIYTLLKAVREVGYFRLITLLISAQQSLPEPIAISLFEPRLAQMQAMLDAAGVTQINATRVFELVGGPVLLWTQLGMPLDAERDTERMVQGVLLAAWGSLPSDRS